MITDKILPLNEYALVFDLDGVLVDTAKYHYLAWKRMAAEIGIEVTKENNEQLKGVSRLESMDIILSWGNVTLDDDRKASLMYQKNEWYKELIASMQPEEILPGVEYFLQEVEGAGFKKGLASASKNAKTVLHGVGLDNYFDAVADGFSYERSKPDPEIFQVAASLLNTVPSKTIVFEDAVAGLQGANAAGAITIGVGRKEALTMADHVITGFEQMSLNTMAEILNSLKP